MNRLEYAKEEIRQRVTIRQVVERYTDKKIVKGVCNCPLHHEKTASFKLDEVKNLYYCFGCGNGGDIYDFIETYFGISFKDALYKLDADFALGIIGQRISVKAQIEARRREKDRQVEKLRLEQKELEYANLSAEYMLINNLLKELDPLTEIWGSMVSRKMWLEYKLDKIMEGLK